jgi:hypothetical protein
MSEEKKPWAFICMKGNKIGGVISPDLPSKEISKFLSDFISDGYSLVTVYDRDEYNKLWVGRNFG